MDNGPTLIERAAALLRDNGSPLRDNISPIESRPFEAASLAASERVDFLRPLTRTCILDRAALAEAGIIMPWLTTSRVVEEFRKQGFARARRIGSMRAGAPQLEVT